MPEVGVPSIYEDLRTCPPSRGSGQGPYAKEGRLTDTGWKPRGILRWRSQVIISGVSHYNFLKFFRTYVIYRFGERVDSQR